MKSGIVFDPIFPFGAVIALGVVLIAATVAVYWQTGNRISRFQSLVLLIFRLIGAVAVVLLLPQPSRVEPIAPPKID